MARRYTRTQLMLVTASKEVKDGEKVIVGAGNPCIVGTIAKAFHAPNCILMTEAGIIDFFPVKPLSNIADATCTKGFSLLCDMIEAFTTITYRGFVDVAILGVGQIDKYGNLNSTAIGDYFNSTPRLPGGGGAPEFYSYANRTILTMRSGTFSEKVDYLTCPGFLDGYDSREKAGFPPGSGPSILVTTKGVFRFDKVSKEMYLDAVFPEMTIEEIKKDVPWNLKVAPELKQVPPPTDEQIEFIMNFSPRAVMGRRWTWAHVLETLLGKEEARTLLGR